MHRFWKNAVTLLYISSLELIWIVLVLNYVRPFGNRPTSLARKLITLKWLNPPLRALWWRLLERMQIKGLQRSGPIPERPDLPSPCPPVLLLAFPKLALSIPWFSFLPMLWVSNPLGTLGERPLLGSPRFHSLNNAGWSDPWFFFYFCLRGMRQAGTWDPFAAVLASGHTPLLLSQKIKRNYKGTKKNCACVQLGQITDNIRKTPIPAPAPATAKLPVLKSWEQKLGATVPAHTPPPKGWVNQQPPSSLTLASAPTPSPHVRSLLVPLREQKLRTCY